jgi:hypothetical protein
MIRFGALTTILGVVLNRLNVYLITFNWKLGEIEIPPWREFMITITIYCVYIATYRFILYRWPVLYRWKTKYSEYTVLEAKPIVKPAISEI